MKLDVENINEIQAKFLLNYIRSDIVNHLQLLKELVILNTKSFSYFFFSDLFKQDSLEPKHKQILTILSSFLIRTPPPPEWFVQTLFTFVFKIYNSKPYLHPQIYCLIAIHPHEIYLKILERPSSSTFYRNLSIKRINSLKPQIPM